MRRVLTVSLIVLTLVVALPVLALYVLFQTQTGVAWAAGLLVQQVEGLSIARVEGTLGGRLTLRGVAYHAPDVTVDLRRAQLHWEPWALTRREIMISTLTLDGLVVAVADSEPAPASDEPFTLPAALDLPVAFRLQSGRASNVRVQTAAFTTALDTLALRLRLGSEESGGRHAANLDWNGLVLAAAGTPAPASTWLQSAQGHWSVEGRLTDWYTRLEARQQVAQAPVGQLRLTGRGDRQSLRLDVTEAGVLGGTASGEGSIAWAPALSYRMTLAAEGVDPAHWNPLWPGLLDLSVDAAGEGENITVNALRVDGTLREQPLTLTTRFAYTPRVTTVEALSGTLGGTDLNLQGSLGDRLDLRWQIDSPDLAVVMPGLRGSLASRGSVSGSPDAPTVRGDVTAAGLQYQQGRIGTLQATLDVDLTNEGEPDLAPSTVHATRVAWGDWQFDTLDATLGGNRAAHELRLDAGGESAELDVTVRGGLQDQQWRGQLASARVRPAGFSPWVLESAQSLTVTSTAAQLGSGCWRRGEARLCLSGRRAGEVLQADLSLSDLQLAYLAPALPETAFIEGVVNGEASVRGTAGAPLQYAATFTATEGRLGQRAVEDEPEQAVSFAPGSVVVSGDPGQANIRIDLPFVEPGGIRGEIVIDDLGAGEQARPSGTLEMSLPSLGFIAGLSPEIERFTGSAQLRLALAGTLAAPQPTGELRLSASELSLATPGLYLETVTLDAQADTSGAVTWRGEVRAEEGYLALDGSAQLASLQQLAFPLAELDARLRGENFPFWRSPEASVWGTPDLSLVWREERLRLTGSVHVPRAAITPTQLPPSAVRVTPDQVIVTHDTDHNGTANGGALDTFSAKIKLTLGDDVSINGFGFSGKLGGNLSIGQSPGKPVLASGELNVVDGEYRAFGQGLVIDRGQLLFAGGSIDNPGLNIRALRRPAADIVVGVNVGGKLQQPTVEIFSEPLMSSSNQLSWLVLGRPFESTDGAESDYITQAALLLGIRGGDYLAKGLGDKLGVDTIGIETGTGEAGGASDVNQAALVIGKYLTPRLYVSYGVGLLESISTVKLRYQFNDRWNVVTESSPLASGGDLNFSIER